MTQQLIIKNELSKENRFEDFTRGSPSSDLFDLQQKLNNVDMSFNKIVSQIQISWKYLNIMNLNENDKNILINALPGLEALFLEKFRLSWLNFKMRFQQQIACNAVDYNSFCMVIKRIENELLTFDSIFNFVNYKCFNTINNDKSQIYRYENKFYLQLVNNIICDGSKVLHNQIRLPNTMNNFSTQRYHDYVIFLKNIPINYCKHIGEGQLRLAHSGPRMILSEGFNFGKIELAINLDGYSFAVKKLVKNSEVSVNVASNLVNLMNNLLGLNGDNILPYTHCIEYTTELWLATPVCDYNLEAYIELMYKMPNLYSLNLRNTVNQIVNGLKCLHHTKNGIVHGNMKPSNILIDAIGNIRLADFGVTKALYKVIQPRPTDIIWWSRETTDLYKINPKKLMCNKETDIQTLGMIVHFILTGGMHPFGNTIREIFSNKKRGRKVIRLNNVEYYQMVRNCLNKRPSNRPSIDAVSQNVCLWSDQKKRAFLIMCVKMDYSDDGCSSDLGSLSNSLDAAAKQNWESYLVSMGLRITGERKSINCCLPSRFLYDISKDAMSTMKNTHPDLSQLANSYLYAFPSLVFAMVNLVKSTKWADMQCFQQYFL